MRKRHLGVVLVLALTTLFAGSAQAHILPQPTDKRGHQLRPRSRAARRSDHLPPTQQNVDLVSKLELTNLEGGIADVGYFKGFA
jgi:hypothetical protein